MNSPTQAVPATLVFPFELVRSELEGIEAAILAQSKHLTQPWRATSPMCASPRASASVPPLRCSWGCHRGYDR